MQKKQINKNNRFFKIRILYDFPALFFAHIIKYSQLKS
ncbi:hypothetical protein KPC_1294 [Acinetobacter stercoris]|uniref:Uncharacterized protein n=1 Tax=Acinetobacter stercoris TaxID=2126983 RepID=A0A2U3MXF7_9GAMM|nr:hypothetical protein KPC_1294 [Acinetobacter stercoris]